MTTPSILPPAPPEERRLHRALRRLRAETRFNTHADLREITLTVHEGVIAQQALSFQSTEHAIDVIDRFERFVNLAKSVEMVEIDGYDLAHVRSPFSVEQDSNSTC
jgi:hypothetical protein